MTLRGLWAAVTPLRHEKGPWIPRSRRCAAVVEGGCTHLSSYLRGTRMIMGWSLRSTHAMASSVSRLGCGPLVSTVGTGCTFHWLNTGLPGSTISCTRNEPQ
jgi:hypothetical protein